LKLYYLNEFLGKIHNLNVDEESDFEEANYNEEWLEDNNWFIIDDQNEKRGIYIPAIYRDREMNWGWR